MKNKTINSYQITVKERRERNNHNSFVLWFTGLSGSGKSTIANEVEKRLYKTHTQVYTLDGDNIRKGINKDLTLSPKDRSENIRRVGEIAKLMVDSGIVVLAAFISPYKKDRDDVRHLFKDKNFIEIYVNASIEECERLDVKGLYKKARAGEIQNMTGISAPYEAPEQPDIELKTENQTLEESVDKIFKYIQPILKIKED